MGVQGADLTFAQIGVEVRSVLIAPQGEVGALNAHLRVATIDGPAVRRALRERGFMLSEPSSGI